jgi:hypothetical protein
VTGNITKGGNNVLTSADTASMLTPYIERGDTAAMLNPYWRSGRFSGTLPVVNGGTGNTTISGLKIDLNVNTTFFEATAGTSISLSSSRTSLVVIGTSGSSTIIDFSNGKVAGNMYMIKNLSNNTVISNASDVILLSGGSAQTSILSAGNVTPQWCTLVCDGTNWHIMQKN